MAILPDLLYQKQREQILQYEDAEFNALAAGVPDFYGSKLTDYTLYGCLLRAVAQELARLQYDYNYDIVAREPQYLTPPDVKRRWTAPLYLGKSFPTPSQLDIDYRTMVVALLAAYPQGATLAVIEDIITAMTGQVVPVLELYKLIGNGIYNDSDRNALGITMDVTTLTGTNPLSGVVAADVLATLSQSVYAAIDLAKPAHIGLNYTLTFGSGETLISRILGIVDTLTLLYYGREAAPLPEILTLESTMPYDETATPNTTLVDTESLTGGKLASQYLQPSITAAQYAALMSDAFRAEYDPGPNGTYVLISGTANDILLVDGSGNPTGVVVKPMGVLAPQLNRCWQVKSDTLNLYRLS